MNIADTPSNVIEIPLSKLKIVGLLIGSLLFVAGGIWFVNNPATLHKSPLFTSIIGYASIIIFGLFVLAIVNKLFDGRAGFVIDDNGIVDNSSTFSVGFIPWVDVTGISMIKIGRQKIIKVNVENPGNYIGRQGNALGRRLASINYRTYGSPINITTSTLRIPADELFTKVTERWEQVKINLGQQQ